MIKLSQNKQNFRDTQDCAITFGADEMLMPKIYKVIIKQLWKERLFCAFLFQLLISYGNKLVCQTINLREVNHYF